MGVVHTKNVDGRAKVDKNRGISYIVSKQESYFIHNVESYGENPVVIQTAGFQYVEKHLRPHINTAYYYYYYIFILYIIDIIK